MRGRDPNALAVLERSLDAHGGRDLWERTRSVRVELRIGGIALALKGRSPLFRSVFGTLDPHDARAEVEYGGRRYRMEGWSIERIAGGPPARKEMRVVDGVQRPPLLWSALDEAHFLSYALWNYALGPWLLLERCTEAERLPERPMGGRVHARVRVRFPNDIPTHCPEQTFWFDPKGRLARLDYTAHALTRWSHGAHRVETYRAHDGVELPARRKVLLRPANGRISVPFIPVMLGELRTFSLAD